MSRRRGPYYESFRAGQDRNLPEPAADPELPLERPEERPSVHPQIAARAACDRPGFEGGISFWDLLEARRGELLEP